jgi:hypothetical protein
MRELTERECNWLNCDWIKVAGWRPDDDSDFPGHMKEPVL